jgi:DNA-binding NarL/FixJ family response regulator
MDKIRVLIADDHPVVRDGTRILLQRESDMEVVGEAADGEEAVALAQQLKPDVAIVDIAMPKMNGIEATKQIKVHCPSTAVLILSAYDDDAYVFALLEAGAAGYLLKYAHGNQVVEAVRAVRSGESVLAPSVARKVLNRFKPTEAQQQPLSPDVLSPREMEVLKLVTRGLSNKEIAEQLSVSIRTVQAHLIHIFDKLGVGSRTEAVVLALKRGWTTLEEVS